MYFIINSEGALSGQPLTLGWNICTISYKVWQSKAGNAPTVLCVHSASTWYTVKNVKNFLSPAGMSITKLSLAGKKLIIPAQGEFGL